MIPRTLTLRIVVGALLAGVVCPARAQNPQPPARPSFAGMINVDALIDNYARFLARKYDLNAEQDAYTQRLLREKANAFLGSRREELFALVDRLFEVRGGTSDMDQQELIAWGQRALPLYQEAKQLIVTSNSEWREILNENQRKIHDQDVQLMFDSFQTTESQLQRIVTGQMSVEEFQRGNRDTSGRRPARPASPATAAGAAGQAPTAGTPGAKGSGEQAGRPSGPPGEPSVVSGRRPHLGPGATTQPAGPFNPDSGRMHRRHGDSSGPAPDGSPDHGRPRVVRPTGQAGGGALPESQWEQYVREFIQKYQLNEEQAQRARSILKDCQDQAQRYMQKHKSDLEDLEKKIADAGKAGGTSKEATELGEKKTKLLEPVGRIFEQQLKPRLEKLPTRAQREAAESGGKGKSSGASGKSGPPPGPGNPPPPPPPPSDNSGEGAEGPAPP